VSDATESGTVTILGTETPREAATATDGDEELSPVRTRVRAEDDAVGAPLGAVTRDP